MKHIKRIISLCLILCICISGVQVSADNRYAEQSLEIESVSGDVSLNKINAEDLLFDSVSSSFTATLLPQTKNIEIDQVSGDVMLTMPKDNEGFVLEFDSISGDLISDFDTRRIDGKIVCGSLQTAQLDIEFSSVSGDLSLLKYVSKEM